MVTAWGIIFYDCLEYIRSLIPNKDHHIVTQFSPDAITNYHHDYGSELFKCVNFRFHGYWKKAHIYTVKPRPEVHNGHDPF